MHKSLLPVVLLVLGAAQVLLAQTGSATLSGRVTDSHGAVLVGAEVVLTNMDTNAELRTKTNNTGLYVFTAIRPGKYRVAAGASGFKVLIKEGLLLHTQDEIAENFSLTVGTVSETMTVSAEAEHLETDNPAVGVLVNRTFVENTPLNGRSLQDLIGLAPGAVSSSTGSGLYSINGQREDANYFVVDGVSGNTNGSTIGSSNDFRGAAGVLPAQTVLGTTQGLASVDTLQEFKIQTSGYTAEYGRQPGGQVQLTTRSGTNAMHGSLFDYFRNTVLDANSWFNKSQSFPRPPEHQNDFGGTVGGPLKIPAVYDGKNKTFYFISYEGLRLINPGPGFVTSVPTMAFRQFVAPGVQPFLNAISLPNGPDSGDTCAASLGFNFSCTAELRLPSASFSSSLDSLSLRVDQDFGERFQAFVRFADVPSSSFYGGNQASTLTSDQRLWTVGFTSRIRPTLLDELRFNYTLSTGHTSAQPAAFDGAVPYPKNLLIPAQYAGPGTLAGSFVNAFINANFFNIPYYSETASRQRQFNAVNSLSWEHGEHTLKFGVDYRRLLPLYNPTQYSSAVYFFSTSDMHQGLASNLFAGSTAKAYPTFTNLSLYAQDHWKMSSRFTIDYGVRWEFNPAPGASNGVYPLALSSPDLTSATIAPSGTPQYRTVYHYFAPRLGFAYEVISSSAHPLVLRVGAGLFYDTGQALGAQGYGNYPFNATNSLSSVPLPASTADLAPPPLGFPLLPPFGGCCGINAMSDPGLKLPYTQQWNVSIDQGLSRRNTLTMSYVGNQGKHLLSQQNYNSFTNINANFNAFGYVSNAGASNYNALQVQDQGKISEAVEVVTSYAWAHSIDTGSLEYNFFLPQRGNSNNDVRQVFNLAMNYRIKGSSKSSVARALSSGWSLDNRFIAQSGYPVAVIQGYFYGSPSNPSDIAINPDLVPGVPIYLHNVKGVPMGWQLNSAAFASVPVDPSDGTPLRQGTLGRNFIRGPGLWSLNTALQRDFPITDRLRLVFRAEAFNVLNHPNTGNVDACTCDGSLFGTLSGTPIIGVPNPLYADAGPRSLQLALKLEF